MEQEQQLALLIYSEQDRGGLEPVLRIRADVVTLKGSKVRNLSTGRWDTHPAANLASSVIVWPETSFWDVEYRDIYSARLEEMQARTRYLAKVTRAMEKVEQRLGAAESFGEFLARFATAIGAEFCVWKRDPDARGGWSHDDQDYRFASPADARRHVDALVSSFRAKQEVTQ